MQHQQVEEHLDVLTKTGHKTGVSKPRGDVHRDGDYHRAVHVWIFAERTQEFLLQRRASCKDSWPDLWDISSAGHISAGDSSLTSARRELEEELGVTLRKDAFELIFVFLQECVINDGKYINNEYNDVYLVTTLDRIPLEAFALQETEVSAVKYISYEEYKRLLANEDSDYVPYDVNGEYGQLFDIIEKRYKENTVARSLTLQKQISRYAPISLSAELTGLTDSDKEALGFVVRAATIMDEIFHLQSWYSNPILRDWLKEHANTSELNRLKWSYYQINKSPWSCLDEDEAFLTTADSLNRFIDVCLNLAHTRDQLSPRGEQHINHSKGQLPKEGFQQIGLLEHHDTLNPHNGMSNFENISLSLSHQQLVITAQQHSYQLIISINFQLEQHTNIQGYKFYEDRKTKFGHLLLPLQRSNQHSSAGFLPTQFCSHGYNSGSLPSPLFHGCGHLHHKLLEQNLPMDSAYKSKDVNAAPIRVIQLLYNAGDVKGPQTLAFNLPNDERIVQDRGSSMVMLKNVSEAKFKHILIPIAAACVAKEQQEHVDFESFFTHTICHECCHGIGPHTITLPNGQKSTVRLELQEFYSALEEAKADIVGLWALRFLISQDLLSECLLKSMYVSFLAGCFRSVRFGLKEAHGKGQALQFNWLYEKGAFVWHSEGTISVDFTKIEGAVESLSREILTIQAKGDKEAAGIKASLTTSLINILSFYIIIQHFHHIIQLILHIYN
uniref:Nudix hydrolase 3 n=1 Tax=Cajanus cajan TaxID=3821 RepID=A0A151S974_CAJCA|nr:Nudix hydrolase 3 [Cajanus cajan]